MKKTPKQIARKYTIIGVLISFPLMALGLIIGDTMAVWGSVAFFGACMVGNQLEFDRTFTYVRENPEDENSLEKLVERV